MRERSRQERRSESGTALGRKNTRTCVGCGARAERGAAALVRLLVGPGGVLAVDAGDGGFGRGLHVHANRACLTAAVERGIVRRLAKLVPGASAQLADGETSRKLDVPGLAQAIEAAFARRISALLFGARRGKKLVVGTEAVRAAVRRGEAELLVFATDAAAAAQTSEAREAVAAGRAVGFGDKASLGSLCGSTAEVAVLAILHEGLALEVRDAVHVIDGVRAGAGPTTGSGSKGAPSGRTRDRRDRPPKGAAGAGGRRSAPAQSRPQSRLQSKQRDVTGARPSAEGALFERPAKGVRTRTASGVVPARLERLPRWSENA